MTRQQRFNRMIENPSTAREYWRSIYRLIRQGRQYAIYRTSENESYIIYASVSREAFKRTAKTLLERLAEHTDREYCHSCDTITEEPICNNCSECSDCCECAFCNGCEERIDLDDLCNTCDRCTSDCCDCNTCSGCDRRYASDNYDVSFCDNCEYCSNGCCDCFFCSNCGSSTRDYCGECDSCTGCCGGCDDSDDGSPYVKQYSTDVTRYCEKKGKPKDGTYYGVELEVNIRNGHEYNDAAERAANLLEGFAILKADSSIGHGFEIVTTPATLEEHRKHFRPFFDNKPSNYLSSWESGKCGIHVHITRPTPLVIGKMLCFLNAESNQHLITTVAGRTSEDWAAIDYSKKVTDWNKPDSRYEALNVTPEKTVELRIFRGTLKEISFWKCLEFAHALLNFARDHSIADLNHAAFLKYVTATRNKRQYKHLIAFLADKGILPNTFINNPSRTTQPDLSQSQEAN
jgi:hypothetical protein